MEYLNALYMHLSTHPVDLELISQVASILLIAPLTARFVQFQNDRKWLAIRRQMVSDIVSNAIVVAHCLDEAYRLLPTQEEYQTARDSSFQRIMGVQISDAMEVAANRTRIQIFNMTPNEMVEVTSPAPYVVLQLKIALTSLSQAVINIKLLEQKFIEYGFIMSPRMVMICSEMMQVSSATRQTRISKAMFDRREYEGSLFLRAPADIASNLQRLVHQFGERPEDSLNSAEFRDHVMAMLKFQLAIDTSAMAGSLRALLKEVGMKIGEGGQLARELEALESPGHRASLERRRNGFAALMTNYVSLNAVFSEMKTAIEQKMAGIRGNRLG